MGPYRVEVEPGVLKALRGMPVVTVQRIMTRIQSLAEDPRPAGCKKLEGASGTWRLRVGDYRIFYWIDDEGGAVTVTRVGHRGDIYRRS